MSKTRRSFLGRMGHEGPHQRHAQPKRDNRLKSMPDHRKERQTAKTALKNPHSPSTKESTRT